MIHSKIQNISLASMIIFYILAGINHFVNPDTYLSIIPSYLPSHETINILAGIGEILGGVMLILSVTRTLAAWGIILMLFAFLPAHIYMIQKAPFQMKSITITPFIAWMRLPIQVLLILWAYRYTHKNPFTNKS